MAATNESPDKLKSPKLETSPLGPQTTNTIVKTSTKYHSNFSSSNSQPPVVYGELSILGYNGYIPNVERTGRRNRSKFLLCQRLAPNGIKKSKHYIVKQPQATKAVQDKDLHSISYTFSRSQTIIVEYRQDENTDMFQIGRSSEDPIDFIIVDTTSSIDTNHQHHNSSSKHNHNENNSNGQQIVANDLVGINRLHRQLAKVGEEVIQYNSPSVDPINRLNYRGQAVLLNYPQPNFSNLPAMMADHFRAQESSIYQHQHHNHHLNNLQGHSSGLHQHSQQQQLQLHSSVRNNNNNSNQNPASNLSNNLHDNCIHKLMCKRTHATQSTISRFACRILVDRKPPYTARIYAAGFDSSKNIFLGEKATKWEQNDSIDGLTTNGVLLMHPKQNSTRNAFIHENLNQLKLANYTNNLKESNNSNSNNESGDTIGDNNHLEELLKNSKNPLDVSCAKIDINNSSEQTRDLQLLEETNNKNIISDSVNLQDAPIDLSAYNDTNNNPDDQNIAQETGGVWREVSVNGGIYAIRESRSAAQKGTRITNETNILQDGTLIDLCGATLLWRSVDGFKASPTKKSLEEKIDLLNATRPQCPVGLNTLVIPRKPILPTSHHVLNGYHKSHHHHHHHHHRDSDKSSHQPYVYLKCGHVQGHHDWGTIDKSNQRTCPICFSVGAVAKLSTGLEPSFYVDSGPLTHVFNPCGHMASEKTVKHWCSIQIPHGTHFFHSICPFCLTALATNESACTKLIFQDDLD